MNDWIEEEGRRLAAERKTEQRRQEVIATAAYWASLLDQLRFDLTEIENNPNFAVVHGNRKFVFERPDGAEFVVVRDKLPAIALVLENAGDTINLSFKQVKHSGEPFSSLGRPEKLTVVVDERTVHLSNGENLYVIPESASEYILKRFIETIREKG